MLSAALVGYSALEGGWLLFAALFLVPDVSMVGYLKDSRLGAVTYNAAHTYLGPAVLGAAAWWGGIPAAGHVAVVWSAHIGLDRLLGYGLKSPAGFHVTHLAPESRDAETGGQ